MYARKVTKTDGDPNTECPWTRQGQETLLQITRLKVKNKVKDSVTDE